MKILQSVAALALLGFGSAAFAGGFPGNGGPLPSVAKQVRAEAKSDGILKGLKAPSVRLQYAANGKTVRATILGMTTFNGTPTPMKKAERLPMYTATFTVGQVMEGRIASPKKVGGRVWSGMTR